MKATTPFLNQIVLVNQAKKLTPADRAAVKQYLAQRWMRVAPSERGRVLAGAAGMLIHYGWPAHITALVLRLIVSGVTADDDLLTRAWLDRRIKDSPALQEAIRSYAL